MPRHTLLLSGLLAAALTVTAAAQVAKGITPFQSYATGSIDSINQVDLNVHIHIPIYNSKGRGLPFQYSLDYDGTIWQPLIVNGLRVWAAPANAWGWQGNSSGSAGSYTFGDTQESCEDEFGDIEYYDDYSNFVWSDPEGVAHSFPDIETYSAPDECGGSVLSGSEVAPDGSGYTLNVTMYENAQAISAAGVVYNPYDASLGRAGASPAIEDANGNEITESDGSGTRTWTDTLGDQIEEWSVTGEGPTQITYPGPSGTETATITYTEQEVGTSMFACGDGGTMPGAWGPAEVDLPTKIAFPDGTSYTMSYAYDGSLDAITLPTGGTISYGHQAPGATMGINCSDGTWNVLQRVTTLNDVEWDYSRNPGGTSGEWISTSGLVGAGGSSATVYSMNGHETERDAFAYEGGATPIEVDLLCYNGNTSNCRTAAVYAGWPITQRNEYRYLGPVAAGTKEAETVSKFNAYGLPTEEDDYDFGSGTPGPLLRRTLTSYASLSGGTVNDRPSQITVDGGSAATTASQTDFDYDQGGVTPTSGTPQHVTGVNAGNLTEIDEYTASGSHLTQHFTYFDTGLPDVATSVTGAQTSYQFAACGNGMLTQVTNPDSTSVQVSWYCGGAAPHVVTDENGQQATYAYAGTQADWQSKPSSVTGPDGTQTLTYTANSVEKAQVFNSGNSTDDTALCFDAYGRPQLQQRRQGPSSSQYDTTEIAYTGAGQISSVSAPQSTALCTAPTNPVQAKTWSYDEQNRPITLTDGGGGTVTYAYDANDVLMTLGPAPTASRQLEYNALGQIASACEVSSANTPVACGQTNAENGSITTYTRDPAGRVTQISETGSGTTQTRTMSFDWLGRELSEANPEANSVAAHYTYDYAAACGSVANDLGSLDERVDPAGNVTCYSHDGMGRLLERWYPTVASGFATPPTAYFVYGAGITVDGAPMQNAAGRLAEAYTEIGSTVQSDEGFSYAADGRVSTVYENTPNDKTYSVVSSTYYPNGTPASLSANLSGLPNITDGVDGEGRWDTVSAGGNALVSATGYNGLGEPTEVDLGSGDKDVYGYDPALGRMTGFTFDVGAGALAATLTWNADGTLGNLTASDTLPGGGGANAQNCNYGYDDLARLSSVNCGSGGWGQTFAADAFGNLNISGSQPFAATFDLTTNHINDLGVTYNADGDVTGDPQHSFSIDANQRVVLVDGVSLAYDALGRVMESGKAGTFYQFVYGPQGRLGWLSSGTLEQGVIPLPGGGAAVYNAGGLAYYRHADWQGSVRVGSTPARALAFDQAFSPYGESMAGANSRERTWADLYGGISGDLSSALYTAQARDLEGEAARWSSPDPAGMDAVNLADPQTLNRYAYTAGQPLTEIDPGGDCPGCPPPLFPTFSTTAWGMPTAGLMSNVIGAVLSAIPAVGTILSVTGVLNLLFKPSAPAINTARTASTSQFHDYAGLDQASGASQNIGGMPVQVAVPQPAPFTFRVTVSERLPVEAGWSGTPSLDAKGLTALVVGFHDLLDPIEKTAATVALVGAAGAGIAVNVMIATSVFAAGCADPTPFEPLTCVGGIAVAAGAMAGASASAAAGVIIVRSLPTVWMSQ